MATAEVTFLPGDGSEHVLPVKYIADFARGPDGTCAFCQGDPCAEDGDETSPIGQFFARCPDAETCPFCHGQAT